MREAASNSCGAKSKKKKKKKRKLTANNLPNCLLLPVRRARRAVGVYGTFPVSNHNNGVGIVNNRERLFQIDPRSFRILVTSYCKDRFLTN
jgi:hypothetical protein